jgi:DNA repair photolyase
MHQTQALKVIEVECKTAMSPSNFPDFQYTLNPYIGCIHGCKYCYAPAVVRIPRREWGETLKVKRNIPKVLAKELKKKVRGLVGISLTTDPYQPAEEKFELTRLCLAQLLRYDFPVCILTKSPLVKRDLDIISQFSEAEVWLTITTNNEEERTLLEPKAPSIESRISVLKEMVEEGIKAYAFLGPLFPTITHDEIRDLLSSLKDAGVSRVMVDRLNLRPGVKQSVLNTISFDTRLASIWKESILEGSSVYDDLFSYIRSECHKTGFEFEIQGY